MRTDILPAIPLQRGGFLRLEPAHGRRVECVQGTVWLTFDDEPRDIVLDAGRGFTVDTHRPGLLYALERSEIVLRRREATS